MPKLRYSVSISLDGYAAGPNQGPRHPLGEGGELLHRWMRETAVWRRAAGFRGGVTNENTKVLVSEDRNIGAIVMGRNMFGGGPGPWKSPAWNGWWGKDPPFHLPVFVLTHHARTPLVCEGGTTFHFVTEGFLPALRMARKAAHGGDVALSGGAGTAKQLLAAGLIDEVFLHLVPVFLGGGVRLFDDPALSRVRLELVDTIEAPGVTHLKYRVNRRGRSKGRG